jgi:hypothetical protein
MRRVEEKETIMEYERLRDLLRKRPFEPFRLHLSDGRTFDIRIPHLNLLGTKVMLVGIPEPNVPDPFPESTVEVELVQINRLEMLAEATNAAGG